VGEGFTPGLLCLRLYGDGRHYTAVAPSCQGPFRWDPPGYLPGPPLPRHDFDESFYVLEGDYVFKLGDRTFTAGVGRSSLSRAACRMPSSGRVRRRTAAYDLPSRPLEEMFEGGPDERAAVGKKLGAEFVGPPLDAEAGTSPVTKTQPSSKPS